MARKLYEIEADIRTLDDKMETWAAENDGDITDFPFSENLIDLSKERERKILSLAALLKERRQEAKEARAVADATKALAKSDSERAAALEKNADRLETFLERNLDPGEALKDSRATISWRKSSAVVVEIEPEKLDSRFQKIEIEANKKAIGDAIKAGEIVEGARIENRLNLQVK